MSLIQKFFVNQDKNIGLKLIFGLLLGIVLLFISNSDKKKINTGEKNIFETEKKIDFDCDVYEKKLELKLENLLSQVKGAGNIKVMISIFNGKEILLAQDINSSESKINENDKSGSQKETFEEKKETKKIIINDKPLVIKEIMPEITGAIIVAEGGDNAFIKSELIRATQIILNIDAHKIRVLKMK